MHFFQTKTNTLFPNTWVFETLTWVFCSWDLSFAVLWPEFLAKMDLSFEKSCLASSYKGIDNFYQPWGHKISLCLHFYVWIQKILSGLFPNTWVFLFLTLSFAKNTWVLAKTWVLDRPEFWSKCTKKSLDLYINSAFAIAIVLLQRVSCHKSCCIPMICTTRDTRGYGLPKYQHKSCDNTITICRLLLFCIRV